MAGPDAGPAIPVWLAEDDLGCIICHELLAWPTTLPCGHSFCRDCLVGLWEAGRRRSCPTCREGGAQPLQLRKNTMLQDLADKYSRAAHELKDRAPVPGPAPRPAPGPRCHTAQLRVAAQKSITEVGRELAELVDQLVDTVRSLQSQSCLPESEPDKDLRTLASALSDGVDLSLASPKLVTSNTPEAKMRDILHDLKKIQGKLQENFTWKGALEEQKQVDITEALSSSSSLLPDQSHLVPKRASSFAQWAISPTFDLGSLSCSLEVSEDHRRVTVSHYPQSYPWSPERPGVVGIWLDFEKEKLAFYSVADQEKLLYEYPVSASFALYPAFWLYGLYPGNSLTVRQVNL